MSVYRKAQSKLIGTAPSQTGKDRNDELRKAAYSKFKQDFPKEHSSYEDFVEDILFAEGEKGFQKYLGMKTAKKAEASSGAKEVSAKATPQESSKQVKHNAKKEAGPIAFEKEGERLGRSDKRRMSEQVFGKIDPLTLNFMVVNVGNGKKFRFSPNMLRYIGMDMAVTAYNNVIDRYRKGQSGGLGYLALIKAGGRINHNAIRSGMTHYERPNTGDLVDINYDGGVDHGLATISYKSRYARSIIGTSGQRISIHGKHTPNKFVAIPKPAAWTNVQYQRAVAATRGGVGRPMKSILEIFPKPTGGTKHSLRGYMKRWNKRMKEMFTFTDATIRQTPLMTADAIFEATLSQYTGIPVGGKQELYAELAQYVRDEIMGIKTVKKRNRPLQNILIEKHRGK